MNRSRLYCVKLESRDNPATVFPPLDPATRADGFQPIPGWSGEVGYTIADTRGTGVLDSVYVAKEGGSVRVVVYSGGEIGKRHDQSNHGDILFDRVIFDPSFRGGGNITSVPQGDGLPDLIVVAPGIGGGPVVKMFTIDGSVDKATLPYSEEYRGGVNVFAPWIGGKRGELVFTPGEGGAPLMKRYDPAADVYTGAIWIGPQDDRSGLYQPIGQGTGFGPGLFSDPAARVDGVTIDSGPGTPTVFYPWSAVAPVG